MLDKILAVRDPQTTATEIAAQVILKNYKYSLAKPIIMNVAEFNLTIAKYNTCCMRKNKKGEKVQDVISDRLK